MKVKFTGPKALRMFNIDWFPGDIKNIPNDLIVPENRFEILNEEKETKKSSKKKKSL